jgi:DNA-binding beta-propeller fold protein YncE
VSTKPGQLHTTIAGTGEPGFDGDGGPATRALLNQPENLAVDPSGNVYIGDLRNHRIRRVDAVTGDITTMAGTGEEGFSGDDGPATSAAISNPFGMVIHPDGDLYFADTENQRIRRIDATSGVITPVAGNGQRGFGGDGGPATGAMLSRPHVLAVHPSGDLLIGDSFNQRIRQLDLETGVIQTIAGTGEQGIGGDGGPATAAEFVFFGELAVDHRSRLYLSGVGNHTIRAIDLETGIISHVAGTGRWAFGGDGGPALEADFHLPYGIDVDDEGNVYVADFWNWRVRKIEMSTGTVSTVAGGVSPPEGTEHYHFHFEAGR